MINKLFPIILSIILVPSFLSGQQETYTITKTPFSKDEYQEFSPVYYKDKLVFCTDRSTGVSNYSTSDNVRFFNIYCVDTAEHGDGKKVIPFAKELNTKLNDGPVSFNSAGDTIYFSRNLMVKGKPQDLSSSINKLGIFFAEPEGEKWTNIREFRFNSEWYNVTTPCLSPNGKRLYFASDKPEGFGGSDIYYSEMKEGYWNDPVNLGPVINTPGNEAYPFINSSGELYFSSDGHPGLGKKDIFFSKFSNNKWLAPVALDPPINSPYEDFGIITDTIMREGYFSSNRNKSIDIFHFTTNYPQIFYADFQRENYYCFQFSDNGSIDIKAYDMQYIWNFGDGTQEKGAVVKHCFPGPGNYKVSLNMVDNGSGKLFFTKSEYQLQVKNFEQAYINAPDIALAGEELVLDGLKSNLPGFRILNYTWDFGDSVRLTGNEVKHSYSKIGDYIINLGLTIKSETKENIQRTGVSKKIKVLNNSLEKEYYLAQQTAVKPEVPDVRKAENAFISTLSSAESEPGPETVFRLELASSRVKIGVNNAQFKKLPKKYTVKETFDPADSFYSYTVDQQMSLMATYPAFKEMLQLGFRNVRIKVFVLTDPAEKELHNLVKTYGTVADSYFDFSDRLTSNAYIMLDQIVKLMIRYPTLKLEVAVHSDTRLSPEISLAHSQRRSEILVDYLVNRGISSSRLGAIGYGGTKPVAPNFLEKDKGLNRRVEFVIIY